MAYRCADDAIKSEDDGDRAEQGDRAEAGVKNSHERENGFIAGGIRQQKVYTDGGEREAYAKKYARVEEYSP
jgi:hypothetical protein